MYQFLEPVNLQTVHGCMLRLEDPQSSQSYSSGTVMTRIESLGVALTLEGSLLHFNWDGVFAMVGDKHDKYILLIVHTDRIYIQI